MIDSQREILFVSAIRHSKAFVYKLYFDKISTLYLDRKIEKQREVHKLLHKFSSRGQGP